MIVKYDAGKTKAGLTSAADLHHIPVAADKTKFRDMLPQIQAAVLANMTASARPEPTDKVRASLLSPTVDPNRGAVASPVAMGHIFAVGGYGRVRPAYGEHGRMASKELRLPHGEPADRATGKAPKTFYTPATQLFDEVAFMQAPYTRAQVLGVFTMGHRVMVLTPWLPHTLSSLAFASQHMGVDADQTRRMLCITGAHQLGQELAEVHAHHVVHRDIKLENILARDENTLHLQLGDFGLAEHNPTRSLFPPEQIGTYAYMSPEMIREEAYSYSTDIYSLGVSLAEVLASRRLFNHVDSLPEALVPAELQRLAHQRGQWHAKTFFGRAASDSSFYGKILDKAFDRAFAIDPVVATFIFKRMMHEDPAQRATAQAVEDFGKRHSLASQRWKHNTLEQLMHIERHSAKAGEFEREFDLLESLHETASSISM